MKSASFRSSAGISYKLPLVPPLVIARAHTSALRRPFHCAGVNRRGPVAAALVPAPAEDFRGDVFFERGAVFSFGALLAGVLFLAVTVG